MGLAQFSSLGVSFNSDNIEIVTHNRNHNIGMDSTMFLGLAITAAISNVDLAHNKQFALAISPPIFSNIRDEENGCTRNGLYCVRLTRENETKSYQILVFEKTQDGARVIFQAEIDSEVPNPRMSLWPYLVILDWREEGQTTPNFIVGVTEVESQMYAGRGLNLLALRLFEIRTTEIEAKAAELLNIEFEGQRNVRSCYNEENVIGRDDFCPTEYHFNSSLAIDSTYGSRYPRFIYNRQSAILPWSEREDFSASSRALNSPGLLRFRDNACTFSRTLTYSQQTSQYEYNEEAPNCSDYLEQ